MRSIFLNSIITLLLTFTTLAAVNKKAHPFAKELTLNQESSAVSNFGSLEVDEEIFSALNEQAGNLRIIDSDGSEVPFLIRTKKGERQITRQRLIPFEKLSLKKLPDNQIEIELRKEVDNRYSNVKLSSVEITSDIKNFEKNISIWSSENRSEWTLIAKDKPIFDYSKFIDIRNSRVSFPPSRSLYFKIRISNISEKAQSPFTSLSRTIQDGAEISSVETLSFTRDDFKINEISFYEKITDTIKDKPQKKTYSAAEFSMKEIDEESLINFTTRKTPITKIFLPVSSVYFYRRFRVEVSDDQKGWRTVHTGSISRVSDDPNSAKGHTINLPHAIRAAFWRITIQNNDSPPLDISAVELEGEIQEIIFYSDITKNYTLLYGAAESPKPVYDIELVLSRAEKGNYNIYNAGEQRPNPHYGDKPARAFPLSRRSIMTMTIIILIAVLGWLIAYAVKSIEKIE